MQTRPLFSGRMSPQATTFTPPISSLIIFPLFLLPFLLSLVPCCFSHPFSWQYCSFMFSSSCFSCLFSQLRQFALPVWNLLWSSLFIKKPPCWISLILEFVNIGLGPRLQPFRPPNAPLGTLFPFWPGTFVETIKIPEFRFWFPWFWSSWDLRTLLATLPAPHCTSAHPAGRLRTLPGFLHQLALMPPI